MTRAAVITVSDSAVAGTREDRSGPALRARVEELGWTVAESRVVSDDITLISAALATIADTGNVDVILTTGGTGIAPRDVTPEAALAIADRTIPGFGELMRAEGLKSTKLAPLSRSEAYTRGEVLIITFPGSPRGAIESLNAVKELIPHASNLLHGQTEHNEKLPAQG